MVPLLDTSTEYTSMRHFSRYFHVSLPWQTVPLPKNPSLHTQAKWFASPGSAVQAAFVSQSASTLQSTIVGSQLLCTSAIEKREKKMLILWPWLVSQCSEAKNFIHCPKSVDPWSRVLTRSNRLQKRVLMKLCSDQISEEVETSTKIAQPTRKIEGFDWKTAFLAKQENFQLVLNACLLHFPFHLR